jgi:hypothetical protein
MNRKSIINAHFQSETQAMAEIFKGSWTSRTPWQKWVGHVVAETLMLGIWSIQYQSPLPRQKSDFKNSGKLISDAWKRA